MSVMSTPHPSHADLLVDGVAPEVQAMVRSLAGTKYQDYKFCTSNLPFMLRGKTFEEVPDVPPRGFFSESLLHDAGAAWVRVRTVRYPDMDELGIDKAVVLVFITYCDGYMVHSTEGLFGAGSLRFIFDIGSGENYLETR